MVTTLLITLFTTISGYTVVRQDAAGLAYIAEDQRPIATRVNVDRARIRGLDAEGTCRFGRHQNYRLYGSGVDAPGANLQVRLRYRF